MTNNNAQPLISIGISACLTGQPVRYDGAHKRFDTLLEQFNGHVDWQPFCPEVEAGLGTPRPPVQLIESNSKTFALGVEDASLDVTDQLEKVADDYWSKHATERRVSGYIFKARSPSCGFSSTPIFNTNREIIRQGDGLFASQCADDIAAVEDTWFQSHNHFLLFLAAAWVAGEIQKGRLSSLAWLADFLSGEPSTTWIDQLLGRELSEDIKQKAALLERLSERWPMAEEKR